MKKIISLGGAGHIGASGVRELVKRYPEYHTVIADYNLQAAEALAQETGGNASALGVDVRDFNSLVNTMKSADAVINYVGPYYTFGESVVKAAIEARTPMVDVCDDGDAIVKMLQHDAAARAAGVPIVVGLGATPGITNLMAVEGASQLDRVDDIHTAWAWTGIDPKMTGRAIIDHYFHAISGNITTFRDGQWVDIPAMSVTRTMEFSDPVGFFEVKEVGHPEPVTIPRYIKGVKNVTNNGGVWPTRFTEVASFMKTLGLADLTEMTVNEHAVTSRDVATSIVLALPMIATDLVEAMIEETVDRYGEFGVQGVALRVDVKGEKNGLPAQYSYRCSCPEADLLTALPAVLGAVMLVNGRISEAGVCAPEGIVDSKAFFELLKNDIPVEKLSTQYM
ncbi:MAG: saccharopine dehydrogenase NADP-binding domain-containing protein [Desulfomonilaceae bacterium]|nr:saccharopine dehydrogenase NADP-binding domain-containing protein [Desulfomonilaceae bacterium]